MLAPELYRQLSLYSLLTSKKAISASFRALLLSPGNVRGCAPFGVMRSLVDLDLDGEACVDAADFLQVLRSLPAAEFTAQVTDKALRWRCGPVNGHLALLSEERHAILVPIPAWDGPMPEETVGNEFATGLELGILACGANAAARALGLQAVQIHSRDGHAYAVSTDNVVVSGCRLGPAVTRDGAVITLHPEAAELLALLIGRDGEAVLAFDAEAVYCATESTELLLNQLPPLATDLAGILDEFGAAEVKVPIFREVVTAFLRRAGALAEAGQKALIEIAVDQGRVSLRFAEAAGSTEEFYLVDGGPAVTVAPVLLEGGRLAKAIAHADHIVFDHARDGVIFLAGKQDFRFGIWGRAGGQ